MEHFFDPERADETGLVALGGDLEPATLVRAYRSGVFPWYSEGDPILWWSPDPRAIIQLDDFHISRRLARTLRSDKFRVTIDHAFGAVLHGCAERPGGTWLTPAMIAAYGRLHVLGIAHSVEAWQGDFLAGGIYGVALGGFFAGESMFAHATDASKVALAHLVAHLRERGYQLFDTQVVTTHTTSLGAIEIPRKDYLARLKDALAAGVNFGSNGKTR